MGFFKNEDEEIDFESMPMKRVHLNLSEFAYDTIQQDYFSFSLDYISTLINIIVRNFAELADASISLKVKSEKEKLYSILTKNKGNNNDINKIIEKLIDSKIKALKNQALTSEKGCQMKIWLNKSNSYALYISDEDQYYDGKHSLYVKALIEEYARKPYAEREKIVFSEFIKDIEQAIKNTDNVNLITVVTSKNKKYDIYPYAVMTDPLYTANYLVGYSQSSNGEKIPCSLRISSIKSLTISSNRSGNLTEDEREVLKGKIAVRGVQFLIGKEERLIVKMNDKGKEKYNRLRHLRPKYARKDGDIFEFNCTEAQAKFYFYKFGEDVEIISPQSLRNEFINSYEQAVKLYEHKKENE